MVKLILVVYIYLFLQMSLVWLIYQLLKNPSVVDVSWPLGLMVAGLIYLWSQSINLRISIIGLLLIIWSIRLAAYLWFSRIRKGKVDKRYLSISKDWKINQSLGFFLNFQLQATFILIISIVFYFIGQLTIPNLLPLDILACTIVMIGIIGESIADWQLQNFKFSHKGCVCNKGLWKYSRHPNYFFDWLTWCGFTLFALHSIYNVISIISPLFLYLLFASISGPITEQGSLQAKGMAYLNYQKNTARFFPWFPKK